MKVAPDISSDKSSCFEYFGEENFLDFSDTFGNVYIYSVNI